MKNVIVDAVKTAKQHIMNLIGSNDDRAKREAELKKLTKDQLVELVLGTEKFTDVKIEDMVKLVLEDERCAWLDYETIASLVKDCVPSAKTTNKSIASYASKYPGQKGWTVIPRKSAAERTAAIMGMIEL